MTSRREYSGVRLWLGLGMALAAAAGGCERTSTQDQVEDIEEAPRELSKEAKQAFETAKLEAAKLKNRLPPAQQVRDDLDEATHELKEKVSAAAERAKTEVKAAGEAAREKLSK